MTSAPEGPLGRVAVALDTADWETFRRWCAFFGPRVGVLKVGLEAFVRWGPAAVREARHSAGRLFLDLKLHDIPQTVRGAVAALRGLGVDLLSLHAAGGPSMLEAAVGASGGEIELLAVTLLTHLEEASLASLELPGPPEARVLRWARLARESGCAGAVCSPREAARLRRELPPPFLLVTPGIRAGGRLAGDDQRRTAAAGEALEAGADLLVIGRPLTRAPEAEEALRRLGEEIAAAGEASGPRPRGAR